MASNRAATPFWTLKQTRPESAATPVRVLGIDDWARRKAQCYGTILVDLERRRPVDLLPDRSTDTVDRWIRDHPGIEVVARDRASCYAEAVMKAAPEAMQAADCFHLFDNLTTPAARVLEQTRINQPVDEPALNHG